HAGRHPFPYTTLFRSNPLPNCRHRAELSKGFLHPDYRRQHLMSAVVDAVVEKAEALQIEQLVLDVRENSHAHRVWQGLGFRSYGDRKSTRLNSSHVKI